MQNLKFPVQQGYLLESYLEQLKVIFGPGLISVIVYGSMVSGEFTNQHSDINLLIVLDDDTLSNLAKASGLVNQNKFSKFIPMFFTQKYLDNSNDVFPIEFLDMKDNYALIFGKDVLKDVNIDIKNLRFQCEQELKIKLLSLKRFYLKNKSNRKLLEKFLFKACASILHILRNLARFKGKSPVYLKADILRQLNQELGINAPSFAKVLEIKNKKLKQNNAEFQELFFEFASDLQNCAQAVDGL